MQKLISLILSVLFLVFGSLFPLPGPVPRPPESETEPETDILTDWETDYQPESVTLPEPETEPQTDPASEPVTDISGSTEYLVLTSAGFPASYAEPLAALKQAHPDWEFSPLFVTGLSAAYTWDYVLDAEIADPNNNLIANRSANAPYFRMDDDPLASGGYRPVSREAVAYYMDPRNFFDETNIFQFFDVSAAAAEDTVNAVLSGTFMSGLLPDGTDTYLSLFLRAGKQYGVSAAYLAVRGRMEQGVSAATPTGTGTCGTAISKYSGKDESNLNGFYNFFNIGAAGKDNEAILRSAALRAEKEGWTTLDASVIGGTTIIANRFVTNYQNTPYLLKFNVDVRSVTATGQSRNFWGQYAQNLPSAYSEGRTLAKAFAVSGCTDGAYCFLIPVYDGMPDTPAPDPATVTD